MRIASSTLKSLEVRILASAGTRVLSPSSTGNGYNYQAAEVARCLRAGLKESEVLPLDESVRILETMDELRQQWGLEYPGE